MDHTKLLSEVHSDIGGGGFVSESTIHEAVVDALDRYSDKELEGFVNSFRTDARFKDMGITDRKILGYILGYKKPSEAYLDAYGVTRAFVEDDFSCELY